MLSVTVMMFRDMVESVTLLNDDAWDKKRENAINSNAEWDISDLNGLCRKLKSEIKRGGEEGIVHSSPFLAWAGAVSCACGGV